MRRKRRVKPGELIKFTCATGILFLAIVTTIHVGRCLWLPEEGFPTSVYLPENSYDIDLSEHLDSEAVPLLMQWDERWNYIMYGSRALYCAERG